MSAVPALSPPATLSRELADLAATEAFAVAIARLLRRGDLLLLAGPFGAGKTAFARALLRELAGDPALEVPSPSFTLVQSYDTRLGTVHHFDLWRLEGPEALAELGWEAARADMVLAEWPERLGGAVPPDALLLTFTLLAGDRRRVTLCGWADRLAAFTKAKPRQALVLMDGLAPQSLAAPTPLLSLGGKTVLDQLLARLTAAAVEEVVVEAKAPSESLVRHLAAPRPQPRLLLREAGGQALAAGLGPEPFFVLSGDSLWFDGPAAALSRLAAAWSDDVDALLLFYRTAAVFGACGAGDFALDPLGRPRLRGEREVVPFVFAGVQLVAPALLGGVAAPTGFAAAWRRALEAGRLRALVHDGLWFRLLTDADVAVAEAALAARRTGWSR